MYRQTGGLKLPHKNEKLRETFTNYLEYSNIFKLSKGSYGITLKTELVLTPLKESGWKLTKSTSDNTFYYSFTSHYGTESQYDAPIDFKYADETYPKIDLYTKMVPNESYGTNVRELIVKICLIHENALTIDIGNKKHITTVKENDFNTEVNIQAEVFQKTYKYLQPLCPSIVYAEVIRTADDIENLFKLIADRGEHKLYDIIINLMKQCKRHPELSVGIIAMECAEEANTLHDMYANYLHLGKSYEVNSVLNAGRFALLKLALDTGYTHNDFHKGNMMLSNTPDYFYPVKMARPMIIDFGRAAKIPEEIMAAIKLLVENKQYVKALSQLCLKEYAFDMISDIQYSKSHYGWVCGDYNMSDSEYEEYIQTIVDYANDPIEENNADPIKVPKTLFSVENMKKELPKPKALSENDDKIIGQMFEVHEKANQHMVDRMLRLHDINPDRYPVLPVDFEDSIYKGIMVGGGIGMGAANKEKRRSLTKKRRNRRKVTRVLRKKYIGGK